MNNSEILIKTISKAVENGYEKIGMDWNFLEIHIIGMAPIYLYNHEFAKSLWGIEEVDSLRGKTQDEAMTNIEFYKDHGYLIPAWQYHLKMMVVSEDPFKYLEENTLTD